MIVQLYKTDIKNPEALVINMQSDLMADLFVPISQFFDKNRIRLKSIITDKLELTIEYFQGDQVFQMRLSNEIYYIFTPDGRTIHAIREEDLEKACLTTKEPENW